MTNTKDNIMIDLETLGLNQNAAIISIGAVRFNIKTGEIGDSFHQNILWESALKYGVAEAATISWWQKQTGAAKEALETPKQITMEKAILTFRDWLDSNPIVWGNGACFDLAKLEYYFESQNEQHPWSYKNTRDVRTITMIGTDVFKTNIADQKFIGTPHHPVDDARNTAQYVCDIYNQIRQASLMGWD